MRGTLRSRPIKNGRQPSPEAAAAFLPSETLPIGKGLEGELAELERLSLDDLRLRWRNHWGRLAPAHLSRGPLLRVMAYRRQADAFGDLDRKTIRMLDRLADEAADKLTSSRSSPSDSHDGLKSKTLSARAAKNPLILKPGALLVREWQGRLERVTVVNDGFPWYGATYTSLSAAAFAITGTKWNGHRFFGVQHRDRVRGSARDDNARRNDRSERPRALARDKADNRPLAARGSSSPSLGATPDAGETVQ